jgi:hypothetical protein
MLADDAARVKMPCADPGPEQRRKRLAWQYNMQVGSAGGGAPHSDARHNAPMNGL